MRNTLWLKLMQTGLNHRTNTLSENSKLSQMSRMTRPQLLEYDRERPVVLYRIYLGLVRAQPLFYPPRTAPVTQCVKYVGLQEKPFSTTADNQSTGSKS